MRVAILGASGFVGRNLMLNLNKNWEVFAFYNTAKDFPEWFKTHKINTCTILVQQDLATYTCSENLNLVPKHFDLVISLIGDTRKLDSTLLPLQNFKSDPLALIGFFKYHTCSKLIHFSSGCIYEGNAGIVSAANTINIHPFTPYAIAKRTSELLLEYFRLNGEVEEYLNVRFFGAYGPYQRADKISTKLIKNFYFDKKQTITLIGNGQNLIDAMYVQDTIDWILMVSNHEFKNQTVDFGYCNPITIETLVQFVAEICGIENLDITWDIENAPKENYFFRLADTWFRPEIPYKYEFKVNLDTGIKLLQQHLEKER